MADEILECVVTKDGSTVIQYDVAYKVTSGAAVNQFCVVVRGDELTDPNDEVEVKTKANVKAKAIKDAWVADLPEYVNAPVEEIVGSVTL
jgi:hypothetical protein